MLDFVNENDSILSRLSGNIAETLGSVLPLGLVALFVMFFASAYDSDDPHAWWVWLPLYGLAVYVMANRKELLAKLHTKGAWRWVTACLLANLAAAGVSLSLAFVNGLFRPTLKEVGVVFGLYIALAIAAGYFYQGWKRCNQPTALELLATDSRAPILYLRPFKNDSFRFTTFRTKTFLLETLISGLSGVARKQEGGLLPRGEQLFVDLLQPMGPVIAIGRPTEKIPPTGAARLYVGDNWKNIVHDLLERSQLILFFAGNTEHFGWEVEKVFSKQNFIPVLLFLPFFQKHSATEEARFIELFHRHTGITLPDNLRTVRLVYFPDCNSSFPIVDRGDAFERRLNSFNPFLCSLSRLMEILKPGWSVEPILKAEQRRRTFDRVIWIGLSVLLLRLVFSFAIN